jgi:hypothetical protein
VQPATLIVSKELEMQLEALYHEAKGRNASRSASCSAPLSQAHGFSDDIVIIVGPALVVSAAISRSGAVEILMKPLVPRMRTSAMQVAVLASAVTALSAS